MTKAQIVGWAHSQFGKTDYPDTEALMAAVAAPALAHAGVGASDVDGIFVGVMNSVFTLTRRDMIEFDGPRRVWKAALCAAGITLHDLSFVETHDCFTIAEMIEYEAMGLTAPGEGYRAIRDGTTTKSGKLPVNPSGGLKSKGHPIGATGVSMHVISAMQLMEEAGDMQIPGAGLAGIFNMGGAAVANYVSILERAK